MTTWFSPGKILGFVLGCVCFATVAQENTDNAVILLYHHVSDETPKSTSISPDLFAEHMAYLDKHHHVMPLQEAIKKLQQKQPLPDKTVVITFDDGYVNILENGHPILKRYNFPYTIFINPDVIGTQKNQLTWQQVKMMQQEGVTFANHTLDHLHLLNRQAGEDKDDWLDRVWTNIEQAEQAIEAKTDTSFKFLAYPFGEYNQTLAEKLADEGYVGFAQYSGAISSISDFTTLPRFPAAGNYARLETLKTKLNSLAMPVTKSSIKNPEIKDKQRKPQVTVTVPADDVALNQLNCFFQGEIIAHQVQQQSFEYTVEQALPVGRSRVNCTAPSKQSKGRYYWYSQPFFVADEKGRYPD
ncbi:polysaccharide deacetylase family protein [Alteromonas sp. MYP5]|uniref:Polysaccharide deacetylase family protein n=1 Tax=Alteromonas ponticola TaxID=2720613 RepID=A0ABX1R5H0_9ALTE|nr:polysaccharide deacetylase family protein [Alteromonas ponticola]